MTEAPDATITWISGPVLHAATNSALRINEAVFVGEQRLLGEVIRIDADELRHAYKAHPESKGLKGEPKYYDPAPIAKWNTDIGRAYSLMIAGDKLIAGGKGTFTLLDVGSGRKLWQRSR